LLARQLGFLINLKRCIGCHGCEFACRNEYQANSIGYRRVINIANPEIFGFLSMACNHCANPECIRSCPQKCYQKRRDGIVLHNSTRCDGCGSCIGACPYRSPRLNPLNKKTSKCNLCFTRLDKGKNPICVDACVQEALKTIDLTGQLPDEYKETIPAFPSVRLTKPSVRFILPGNPRCSWKTVKERRY